MTASPATKYSELKVRTIGQVLTETNRQIDKFRRGEKLCLRTRWSGLNTMLLGGFYFGQTYLLAGASGHGKSYFINMLLRDFTDRKINRGFPAKFKMLHFGFEMPASAEILRRVSGVTKLSYNKLLSIESPLSDAQYEEVKAQLVRFKDEEIYFVESPGSRFQIYATIKAFREKFPDDELVITLDHMLLTLPEPGEDEIQLLAEVSKMFIQIRKEFNSLNILVGQLNDKIEDSRRRDPAAPGLHYPTKTDIHGSKQAYQAADVVMIIHRPELLNLESYGPRRFPTKNLVALHTLKNRNGESGLTLFTQDLAHGSFVPWEAPVAGYITEI